LQRHTANGQLIEEYEIIVRGQEPPERDSIIEILLSKDGPCGRKSGDDPLTRPCTPPFHYHHYQNESVTVLGGLLGYYLGDKNKIHIAKVGETVTFPYHIPHTYWSLSVDKDLILRLRTYPALNSATYYENYISIKRDQLHPWLRYLNLLLTDLESDTYIADLPPVVNKLLNVVLYGVGRLVGLKPYYPEYSTILPRGY
jgi:hypothetical protein